MGDYQEKYKETKEKDLVLWKETVLNIFGEVSSDDVTIRDRQEILNVLNSIGTNKAENHTFMPSGGGLDLTGAEPSKEPELIELNFGGLYHLVHPASLTFHAVGDNPEWWYFRLNTGKFNPTKIYDHYFEGEKDTRQELFPWSSDKQIEWEMQYIGEEVLDIGDGTYLDREYWEVNNLGYEEDGKEIPLPPKSRIVTRMFNGGAFVIFPKFSSYNNTSSTYDGRHNAMDSETFRKYIGGIEEKISNT